MRRFLVCFLMLGLLWQTACGTIESEANYPDQNQERRYKHGSVLGDEGFTLFGGSKKDEENNSGLGVNGYLWRASLDTVSFMPIASADPFGGVILTDWYSAPDAPNERSKVNIAILDRQLRADGVRVSVFRQVKTDNEQWTDSVVTPGTARSLEDAILTRARQMRVAKEEADSQ